MQLYVSTAHFLTWVSFLVLLTTVASKPLLFCQRQHQQVANPRRHVDFLRAMSSVNDHITKHKLYVESSFTDVSPPIYVFLQCRQDLSVSHCRRCFNDSKLKLEETCSSSNSGRVHGDNCFLRFDNRDFSEEFVDPRFDRTKCKRTGPVVDKFWIDLDEAFVNATLRAVKKGGFGAASVSPAGGSPGVYALAQCWQRLDGNSCRDCLVNARSSLRACESSEARAFFTGCYLKYSTRKFFDDAAVLKLDDGM
ncbi:cysteine-rich receptor-like protein kinase 1 [Brassica napus]|uniref:cysteine-rich receptor-like protein kinase 1 n=1 Tax=Brassica napus TaxID=3708 RepID=UPI002079DA40|nr:cysteine-rich receptor-like protein kinase 1 [Brassica napus]